MATTRTSPTDELGAGIAFWKSRGVWPSDLHNADYVRWTQQNPHGNFTLEWWEPFLTTLHAWRATRPMTGAFLTERFLMCRDRLSKAWTESCEPLFDSDISTVTWDQVAGFPAIVAEVKPLKEGSPVFPSKFCHFLMPKIFPVVDDEGLGNRWRTYEGYFRCVQEEWDATKPADRTALIRSVTKLIEQSGSPVFDGFPMVNKIVELRLIGRRHPT